MGRSDHLKLQQPQGWDPLCGEHPEVNQVESLYGVNTQAELGI